MVGNRHFWPTASLQGSDSGAQRLQFRPSRDPYQINARGDPFGAVHGAAVIRSDMRSQLAHREKSDITSGRPLRSHLDSTQSCEAAGKGRLGATLGARRPADYPERRAVATCHSEGGARHLCADRRNPERCQCSKRRSRTRLQHQCRFLDRRKMDSGSE